MKATPTDPTYPAGLSAPNPDHAWAALDVINGWIRHADAKAAVTLTAAGVIGGLTYSLVGTHASPGRVLIGLTAATGLAAATTAACAAVALIPRLRVHWWRRADPASELFFRDIARKYRDDAAYYADVLAKLSSDPQRLARQIAQQVHANANVAHRKYRWTNAALMSLTISIGLLAASALINGSR